MKNCMEQENNCENRQSHCSFGKWELKIAQNMFRFDSQPRVCFLLNDSMKIFLSAIQQKYELN